MPLNEKATAEVAQHRARFGEVSADQTMTPAEKSVAMTDVLEALRPHFTNYAILGGKQTVREILVEFKEKTPKGEEFAPVHQSLAYAASFNARYEYCGS